MIPNQVTREAIFGSLKWDRTVRSGVPTLTLVSGGQEQSTTYGLLLCNFFSKREPVTYQRTSNQDTTRN
jgi:hypothetical protein